MACEYGGVTIVLSAVGVDQAGESANRDHYAFIDDALRKSASRWKICAWHMTMANMQVSYKGDSVGWGAYEICRKHGAFIVTGHAHTYSRTRELKRFGTKRWSHTSEDIQTNGPDDDVVHLRRVLLTLVPIRPRRRGERRSLRTFLPAHLSAHPSLSIPTHLDAFQLHLTPFNSTPTFARMDLRPSSVPGRTAPRASPSSASADTRTRSSSSAPHFKAYETPPTTTRARPPQANKLGALARRRRRERRARRRRDRHDVRRVLYTGPHTTALAMWTPILKDFARRISPPTPPFQYPPSAPFNSN